MGKFSRQVDIFLFFPEKRIKIIQANYPLRIQFAWDVQSYYLSKKIKMSAEICIPNAKRLPRMSSRLPTLNVCGFQTWLVPFENLSPGCNGISTALLWKLAFMRTLWLFHLGGWPRCLTSWTTRQTLLLIVMMGLEIVLSSPPDLVSRDRWPW